MMQELQYPGDNPQADRLGARLDQANAEIARLRIRIRQLEQLVRLCTDPFAESGPISALRRELRI
jgi:hypothetical protein